MLLVQQTIQLSAAPSGIEIEARVECLEAAPDDAEREPGQMTALDKRDSGPMDAGAQRDIFLTPASPSA